MLSYAGASKVPEIAGSGGIGGRGCSSGRCGRLGVGRSAAVAGAATASGGGRCSSLLLQALESSCAGIPLRGLPTCAALAACVNNE